MTLIATFTHNSPVLFGDLLVTGFRPSTQGDFHLPAIGNARLCLGDGNFGVKGLRQKINIISRDCAVAFAGQVRGGEDAVEALRALANRGELTKDSATKCLEVVDARNSIFCYLVDRQFNQDLLVCGPATVFQSRELGRVTCAGSGQMVFQKEWKDPGATEKVEAYIEDKDYVHTVGKCLSIGAKYLEKEVFGGVASENIRAHKFGGGFEAAMYFGDVGFRKINDVVHLIWQVFFSSRSGKAVLKQYPSLVVKQDYFGDVLVVTSWRPENIPRQINVQTVLPMFKVPTPDFDPTKLTMNASWMSHYFGIYVDNRFLGSRVISDFKRPGGPKFPESVASGAGIDVPRPFHDSLIQELKTFVRGWGQPRTSSSYAPRIVRGPPKDRNRKP